MDKYSATEAAYKNGYKQGKQDAVVHGRWEKIAHYPYYCSCCDEIAPLDNEGESHYKSNFCPNCGAKMDGEETKNIFGISQRTVQALERMVQKVHGGEDGT